jgi:hypothetical protein
MLSLKQIVEKESFLIVDSNILTSSTIMDEIYDAKRFKHISVDSLQPKLQHFQQSYEILIAPNTNIVDTVVDEFRPLKIRLSDKLSYLIKNERGLNYERREYHEDNEPPQRIILEQICEYLPKIEGRLKRKIFKPANQEIYTELVDLMKYLRTKLNLKKFYERDKSHYRHPYESKNPHCTDEKIAATALYNVLYECSPTSVLTNDPDITILASGFSQIAANKTFAPENKILRARTQTNPIRIYTSNISAKFNEYSCCTSILIKNEDSREFALYKRGSSEKLSDEETAEGKQLISHCIKNIVEQSRSAHSGLEQLPKKIETPIITTA